MILKVISILLILVVVVNAGKYYKKKPKPTTAAPAPPTAAPTEAPTAAPTAEPTTQPPPMPYKYAYTGKVGSPYPTGQISAQESSSGGVVTGSYSLLDTDGRQRTVIYRADNTGFHATVKTNELPVKFANPADVVIIQSKPPPAPATTGPYDYGY